MEKVIEVQGLKREYITKTGWLKRKRRKVLAVNGIDFSVERGEIFGLLGENSAGIERFLQKNIHTELQRAKN